ncbi:MAG: hypothetical protein HY815_05600 [Candidatus Riflebacteria bacterium]|nr:hypothetical protein [Candidatus Riflebacteria bacterium]
MANLPVEDPVDSRRVPMPAIRGVLIAACLLVVAASDAILAADPQPSPQEDIKGAVERDCQKFRAFCRAKHAHVKDALKRDAQQEAKDLTEKILMEEQRTLRRVIWYLGLDRSRKARAEAYKKVLEKSESMNPESSLKQRVENRFALPAWISDPLGANLDEEPAAPPAKKAESGSTLPKSGAGPSYGVSGAGGAVNITPVAAPPPVVSEKPPPPPPPPAPSSGPAPAPQPSGPPASPGSGSRSAR